MTGRRPASAPRGRMSDAQADAVTTELGRLVLGGRPERPELEPTRSEILDFYRTRGLRRIGPSSTPVIPVKFTGPTGQNPIIKGRRA